MDEPGGEDMHVLDALPDDAAAVGPESGRGTVEEEEAGREARILPRLMR